MLFARAAEVAPFRSDRSWSFAVDTDELWSMLTRVDRYPAWWPWLARFHPIGGFQPGARWSCTVSPPLPYEVHFSVLLDDVDPGRSVRARVTGDIDGDALLTLDAHGDTTTARLRSELAPARPALRRVGGAARPLVEWGHDWVLDQGQRQFVEHAAPSPDR